VHYYQLGPFSSSTDVRSLRSHGSLASGPPRAGVAGKRRLLKLDSGSLGRAFLGGTVKWLFRRLLLRGVAAKLVAKLTARLARTTAAAVAAASVARPLDSAQRAFAKADSHVGAVAARALAAAGPRGGLAAKAAKMMSCAARSAAGTGLATLTKGAAAAAVFKASAEAVK